MQMQELRYWVWLSSLTRIVPSRKKMLLEHFKDPYKMWEALKEELKGLSFMTEVILNQLTDNELKRKVDSYVEDIYRKGIDVITILDEKYPVSLKNIYDPPIVLYIKGSLENCKNCIAVVGSRHASSYGLKAAENISYELSQCGMTIVSGLARGIDAAAHAGALKNDGKTIAVMGCGPDIVYPRENRGIYENISQTGAVISEYLPGTQPLQYNFPARNRIISGLSYGTVVVEAGEKSGSLITADFALNQGREVFAVPGNISSRNSAGANRLIREGAKIVTGVYDILEELRLYIELEDKKLLRLERNKFNPALAGLSMDEKIILECLIKEPMHVDTLAAKTGFNIKDINSMLVIMELRGIIESLPGRIYELK
jgi:DNA processing protein